MAEEMKMNSTDDDRLWATLAYVFPIIVPIIVLLMEDKKARPYIKFHSVQALVLGVAGIILAATVIGSCITLIIFGFRIYWAVKAYNGEEFEIPMVTNFVKEQGWA